MSNISEFEPLGRRVLIKFELPKDKFGSIILPDKKKQQLMESEILDLGEIAKETYGFKKGDKVFTPYWVGIDMEFYNFDWPEGNYKLIVAEEILARKRE